MREVRVRRRKREKFLYDEVKIRLLKVEEINDGLGNVSSYVLNIFLVLNFLVFLLLLVFC